MSRAPDHAVMAPIDRGWLDEVIQRAVDTAVARLDEARARVSGQLAYSEADAAGLLGLRPHQLRDERRRGRIPASRIVGGQIRYAREDLIAYLLRRREAGEAR